MAEPSSVVGDTGDFAEGNRDFSRYTNPVMCVQAAELVAHQLAATIDAQVKNKPLQYTPFRDTITSRTVAIAKSCGRRFSMADPIFTGTYALANLKAWFIVSLMAMDDAQAGTIRDRMFANAPEVKMRDQLALWVVDQYLQARPVRLESAKSLLATIDGYGRPSLLTKVLGHNRLLLLADTAFDRAMIFEQGEHVEKLAVDLTATEMCWTGGVAALVHAHTSEMTAAAIDHSDTLPKLVATLQEQFRLPEIQRCIEMRRHTMFQLPDYSQMDVPAVVQRILSEDVGLMSVLPGHVDKQTPVTGPVWYPAADHETRFPVPGKVSMLVFLPTDLRWEVGYEKMNMELRRWLTRYGDAGFTVTVLAAPHGHALWGSPESPAELGKSFDWYYHRYLGLPLLVGLDSASHLPSVPAPDGRRYFGMSALESAWQVSPMETKNGSPNYWYRNDGLIMLVNRTGDIIYRTGLGSVYGLTGLSPVLETLLVREFTPVAGTAPATSLH